MIAYQYHADGTYAGEIEDFGLLPSRATRLAPPQADGFFPVWNGHAWTLVEDHRGESGFLEGEAFEIKELGPYPEGFSKDMPEPSAEEKLAQAREQKAAEIEAGYDEVLTGLLSMSQTRPGPAEMAILALQYRDEDKEEFDYMTEKHAARKNQLVDELVAAETLEAVEAIQVKFAV